jgi:hypothetical protein
MKTSIGDVTHIKNPYTGVVYNVTSYAFFVFAHPKENDATIYGILPNEEPFKYRGSLGVVNDLISREVRKGRMIHRLY